MPRRGLASTRPNMRATSNCSRSLPVLMPISALISSNEGKRCRADSRASGDSARNRNRSGKDHGWMQQ